MIKTTQELKEYLSNLTDAPKEYRIAVGSLIFTPDDRVILLERGQGAHDSEGLLEGVGGAVHEDDSDLLSALQREVKEEIGDVEVEI